MFKKQLTNKQFNFISGLPRSGSTLLTSILNQNPRFFANISDPLCNCVTSIIYNISCDPSNKTIIKEEKLDNIVYDFFNSYYNECHKNVIFNTNRRWTKNTHLLKKLYPNFKMIVCIRDIPWVINSIEEIYRKNCYAVTPMVGAETEDVYERAHLMMSSGGFISESLLGVKSAIACNEQENLLFLEYDALVKHPDTVIKRVYDFLEQPYFNHDFNNVAYNYTEYDKAINCEGLHNVRQSVKYNEKIPIIPQDLWNLYMHETIWKTHPFLLNDKNAILS